MKRILSVLLFINILISFNTSAATINWVDFSSWTTGALSGEGFSSLDGLTLDANFSNTFGMRSGYPSSGSNTLDDPMWPFENNDVPFVRVISSTSTSLSTVLTYDFTSEGGLPAGGSLGIIDMEGANSSVKITGFQDGLEVGVNWDFVNYELVGSDGPAPDWDSLTNTLSGNLTGGWANISNFAFLVSDTPIDTLVLEINGHRSDAIGFAVSASPVPAPATAWMFLCGLAISVWVSKYKRR